jgi:phosphatidylglycerol lysyltransferase
MPSQGSAPSESQPRMEPMSIAFRDEADLTRIGIAITRAFIPDAGVGHLAGIVKSVAAPRS